MKVTPVRSTRRMDLLPVGQGVLPALLQHLQPRPCQPPFELEREGPRVIVDRDSQHC